MKIYSPDRRNEECGGGRKGKLGKEGRKTEAEGEKAQEENGGLCLANNPESATAQCLYSNEI